MSVPISEVGRGKYPAMMEGDIARVRENEAQDRGGFVLPLLHRGGTNREISQLTGLRVEAVAGMRRAFKVSEMASNQSDTPFARVIPTVSSGEVARAHTLVEQNQTIGLAQGILDRDLIGDNLQHWNEMQTVYAQSGRQLPASFAEQIALEAFVKTRKDLRSGRKDSWRAYERSTKEFVESGSAVPTSYEKEEQFVREIYKPTEEEKVQALGKLNGEFRNQLLAVASRSLLNLPGGVSAEDAVSETSLKVWNDMQNPDTGYPFDNEDQARHFVFTIIGNYCRDRARRQSTRRETPIFFTDSDDVAMVPSLDLAPEQQVIANEGSRTLHSGIARLRPDYRRVLTLRYLEELTIAEAAAAMGKSKRGLQSLQHRAENDLRRRLTSPPTEPTRQADPVAEVIDAAGYEMTPLVGLTTDVVYNAADQEVTVGVVPFSSNAERERSVEAEPSMIGREIAIALHLLEPKARETYIRYHTSTLSAPELARQMRVSLGRIGTDLGKGDQLLKNLMGGRYTADHLLDGVALFKETALDHEVIMDVLEDNEILQPDELALLDLVLREQPNIQVRLGMIKSAVTHRKVEVRRKAFLGLVDTFLKHPKSAAESTDNQTDMRIGELVSVGPRPAAKDIIDLDTL